MVEQASASGQSLTNILKENGLVDDDQFARIVAAGSNIEFVNLSADMIDPMAAHMVTHDIANKHNIIPIKKEGNNLQVAMSSPLNLVVRDQIEARTGCKVTPLAAAGEESGTLSDMLNKGADFLDKDIDRAIKALLVKLELIITAVMGIIVGFVLIAVYLPMFDYMGHLK